MLVRYLLADDPGQHAAAVRFIEDDLTPEAPGLVHPVVLCEVVWVLQRAYRVPKEAVAEALGLVLSVRTLRVLDEPIVRAALDLFRRHSADFADCVLATRRRGPGS